jgi:hypothetical protein
VDLPPVASRSELDGATSGWFYEPASRSIWAKVATGGATTLSYAP